MVSLSPLCFVCSAVSPVHVLCVSLSPLCFVCSAVSPGMVGRTTSGVSTTDYSSSDGYPRRFISSTLTYDTTDQVQLIFRDLPSDFDDLGFMDSVTELYVTQEQSRHTTSYI